MENALSSTASIPTFRKSKRKIETKTKTHMLVEAAAVHERDCSKRRDTKVYYKEEEEEEEEEDKEDEEGEVERKIVALQRTVPGGESLGVDKLFEETASYILALQGQIKAMKGLVGLIQGSEKEKRKFGG